MHGGAVNRSTPVFAIFALSIFPMLAWGDTLSLPEFQAKMQAQMARLSSKNTVSIDVQVLGRNQILFAANENKQLNTASSMKLLTTQAAFAKMGEQFSFATNVYVDGVIKGDTLQGNLVLQGNGDPFLVSERIWLLAKDVARFGIKHITGGIKVNNSAFSEDYRGLLEWEDTTQPFAAVVSATSLNFNSVEVHVTPAKTGAKPNVEVGPTNNAYIVLVNKLRSVSGGRNSISIRSIGHTATQETFELEGSVGRDAVPSVVYATVTNPAPYVADVFAALLRANGMQIAKDFVGVSFKPEDIPNTLLVSQQSLSLLELARLYNSFSNNFMAEEIYHGLGAAVNGAPAAISKSRQTILDYVKQTDSCRNASFDNGSGLTENNGVSSKCFVDNLQNAYRDFPAFADLVSTLPIGGKTGTLKNRFKNHDADFVPENVRAKSGTLWAKRAVTALVGVTTTAGGETLVFSVLQNDERGNGSLLAGMREWEDKCVELMQRLKL